MKKVNVDELSYIENITMQLIVREVVEAKKDIFFSKQVRKIEQKNIKIMKYNDELLVHLYICIADDTLLFQKCVSLQKEIIDEIKWMINFNVCEVNIHLDKLITHF